MNLRHALFVLLILLSGLTLISPSPAAASTETPVATIKSKVRVVVVDVVVTNSKGEPVTGLHDQDFEVREDRKPQTVLSFEEHLGAPLTVAKRPPLPANVYTNAPLTKAADSVNVLLLDALNTQAHDQSEVRRQMLAYLKTLQPGTRVAIFTLASRLQMLQGFTTDSSALLAVLNNKKGGAGPQPSAILPSETETQANEHTIDFMKEADAPQVLIDAMKQFQADLASFETASRVKMTLQALQELARYLSDIPGRKNVIWFSSSFPISILPDSDAPAEYQFNSIRYFQNDIAKTADTLAASHIAIYPIAAEGLTGDYHYEANGAAVGEKRFSQVVADQNQHLHTEERERYSNHTAMESLADATGGHAFYNTNGLGDALARVINDGSRYYTLSYTPTNTKMNGKFRHIQIKLRDGSYKLSYRRGYYAAEMDSVKDTKENPDNDPLLPLMGRNMPAFSQIVYKIRVLPANPQPLPGAPIIGGNSVLKGPFTRYSVDFAIPARYLKLEPTPDGGCTGGIEIMLVAYDRWGKPLNFVGTTNRMVLKPSVYDQVIRGGLQLHREIDVPNGVVFLQTGVYDLTASTAGTLGVSMRENPALASTGQNAANHYK